MPSHLDTIREYFATIERGADFEEVAQFLSPDVVQREFSNRFVPEGATRGLADLRQAAERGGKVMQSQRYEILNAVSEGTRVALEVRWTGVLAVPVGKLAAGQTMRARFGVFFEFEGEKISQQHNYDCFDPFQPARHVHRSNRTLQRTAYGVRNPLAHSSSLICLSVGTSAFIDNKATVQRPPLSELRTEPAWQSGRQASAAYAGSTYSLNRA